MSTATATTFTVAALRDLLRAATPEELAEIRTVLGLALPEKSAPTGRAVMAARAAAAAALLPEAADGMAPTADAYRMAVADIDDSVCVGRRLADSTKDSRWKPAVYREFQCGKTQAAGGDLCETCRARKDRYDAAPGPKVEWMGRITEEPLGWLHMLGTDWATGAKGPKWVGGDGGSDAASVSSAESGGTEKMSMSSGAGAAAAAAPASVASSKAEIAAAKAQAKAEEAIAKAKAKAEAAAAKEAAKAEEKAAKEAAKAEEKAAKEAAKAEEKAAKEAAKAEAAAAKEAEKAAKAAAKEAEKAAKEAAKAKPKAKAAAAAPAPAPVAAKAAPTTSDTATTAGEIKFVGGDLYILKGRNVYSFVEGTETAGDFVGRLSEDGESIDADADEE
jgi:hypothetical protein